MTVTLKARDEHILFRGKLLRLHEEDFFSNKKFLGEKKRSARDNGRTPFQLYSITNAGFISGRPWWKVNPDYIVINEAKEEMILTMF